MKNLTAVAAFVAAMILAAPAMGGTASWYGPGFHGRTTANGERYDQSAAHRIAAVMAWEGVALDEGQLRALYYATRDRFGV